MLNIILIGPQGCGKGTQAQLILQKYGLIYIEAGAMIRQRALLHDKKSDILNHLVNQKGILLPDGIIMDMICDELDERVSMEGYLFDGFPRSVVQYQSLKEYLAEKQIKLNVGLYIHISDEEALKRLGGRRLCAVCKKGYSIFLEPQRTKCECGGELIKRIDDEPAAIKHRLEEFHNHTSPILQLMKSDDILKEINGEQSIEAIFLDIQKQLDTLK
ncbi:MAG: nucleoside monophosphate kinase [Candidatus Roizmanbacteria bacterium]|nr:nucleoside monophosphate kinase [Candidatus Roizmanbacteria bacterium]